MNELTTTPRSADVMFDDHARQTALDFCQYALDSGLLPEAIKSAQDAVLILLKGREMGMSDMEALNTLYIFKRKIGIQGTAMCSVLTRAGIAIETVRSDENGCELIFHRKVGGIQLANPVSFSLKDAERAQLLDTSMYKKWPSTMLYWRAVAMGARRHGADVLGGAYLPEEIEHMDAPSEPAILRDVENTKADETPKAVEANDAAFSALKDQIAACESLHELKKLAVDVDGLAANQIDAARAAWVLRRDELQTVVENVEETKNA